MAKRNIKARLGHSVKRLNRIIHHGVNQPGKKDEHHNNDNKRLGYERQGLFLQRCDGLKKLTSNPMIMALNRNGTDTLRQSIIKPFTISTD